MPSYSWAADACSKCQGGTCNVLKVTYNQASLEEDLVSASAFPFRDDDLVAPRFLEHRQRNRCGVLSAMHCIEIERVRRIKQ